MTDSLELVRRWRDGDEDAATAIFNQYVQRVLALARTRLSAKMQRRIDPADVTQSAYQSFFRRVRNDELILQRSGDLWRLLAAITINKVKQQVRHHRAQKRHIEREESWQNSKSRMWQAVDPETVMALPQPDDAAALIEEVEAVMSQLTPRDREVVTLRLQGAGIVEIAEAIGCAERTVRRVLDRVRQALEERL